MSELVKLTRLEDIAIVTIHNPPVNALSPGVPEGILHSIDATMHDPSIQAVVVIGAGSTFVAGADIREIPKGDVRREAAWFAPPNTAGD